MFLISLPRRFTASKREGVRERPVRWPLSAAASTEIRRGMTKFVRSFGMLEGLWAARLLRCSPGQELRGEIRNSLMLSEMLIDAYVVSPDFWVVGFFDMCRHVRTCVDNKTRLFEYDLL